VPSLIFIAGPNGAGKTTFASEYLAADDRRFEFVNADEIARALPDTLVGDTRSDVLAARRMLGRIDELIKIKGDFVIETTLASLTYARKIPNWRAQGYVVTLIYLRLPSVDASLARVRRRVEAGGHDIPRATIRRRFGKSLDYFETVYKPLVDVWYCYESREGGFVLLDSWTRS
jgi:predicted ABC-type ATPase